jgi:hypothetical protein
MNMSCQSTLKIVTAADMRTFNPEWFRICFYIQEAENIRLDWRKLSRDHSTQNAISLRFLCKKVKFKIYKIAIVVFFFVVKWFLIARDE